MQGPVGHVSAAQLVEQTTKGGALAGMSKFAMACELRTKPGNIDLARALLLVAARDEPDAMFEAAMAFTHQDWGFPCLQLGNVKQVFAWLTQAARAGHGMAMAQLASMYKEGAGCVQDKGLAREWWKKAEATGDPLAQVFCLESRVSAPQLLTAMLRVAELGRAVAQYHIGAAIVKGKSTSPDLAKGFRWLSKAAVQNYSRAQFLMGWAYEMGTGVARDLSKAFYWYDRAANQGLLDAMIELCPFSR
jgi:TPR repeat protein